MCSSFQIETGSHPCKCEERELERKIKELESNLDNLLIGLECKLSLKEHLKCPEHYLSLGKSISKSAWEYKDKIKEAEEEIERLRDNTEDLYRALRKAEAEVNKYKKAHKKTSAGYFRQLKEKLNGD